MNRATNNSSARRGAGGVVGAAVVGVATLAILLVCFALYQASQKDSALEEALNERDEPVASVAERMPGDGPTAPLPTGSGEARIGSTRDITFTQFGTRGSSTKATIRMKRFDPVPESDNEWSLISPEIDMRTPDGQKVRVTADEGVVERAGRSSTRLEARRGRLRGHVVIVVDRRTDADRAALPEADRDRPDPASVMRVEMDEVRFDLEYGKVVVPGPFRLSASDVRLNAADLEVRFNEAAGRVDFLRIERGDLLELLPSQARWNDAVPDAGLFAQKRMTLVELLRATLEKRMAAQEASRRAAVTNDEAVEARGERAEDEPPPFTPLGSEPTKSPRAPVKYLARFERDVDVVRRGGEVSSRLQADMLEILRDLTEADGGPARTPPGASGMGASPEDAASASPERIILNWTGPLVVEALDPEDERIQRDGRARVTATGSPVRLSHDESKTDAQCSELVFLPDESSVVLRGSAAEPAVVRSESQGLMAGREIRSRRMGDDLEVFVAGPGYLLHGGDDARAKPAEDADVHRNVTKLAFQDRMEVAGRFVTRTRIDFTGAITTMEARVLDRADFFGDVVMTHEDTALASDEVALRLKEGGGRAETTLDGLIGRGHVVMSQGEDRLTCARIDLDFITDADGRLVPHKALAEGNVEANQGSRAIKAQDRLKVWFDRYDRPAPPFDVVAAHARAVAAGEDITEIDWDARRRAHESQSHEQVGASRIEARGRVTVRDDGQDLALRAESLDCTIPDGRRIDRATVTGAEDSPASVRLGTFTVEGATIEVRAEDQWALVPGRGRMTLLSYKDLNGRAVEKPSPVVIDWEERMEYQGRENRALVLGEVHAVSAKETTFDCERLVVLFEDVAVGGDPARRQDWWIFSDLASRIGGKPNDPTSPRRLGKQVSRLDATGSATILTASRDEQTGALLTRARLSGPKLLVNLSRDASKLIVEGAGTLLLEDHRARSGPVLDEQASIFAAAAASGRSVTAIEWTETMWYDFSLDQTRFQGDVVLKHFSGEYLDALLAGGAVAADERKQGRRTFLQCDRLTIDFLDDSAGGWRRGSQVGRINARSLRQFQALGNVQLEDGAAGLWARCGELVFEKDRDLLRMLSGPTTPVEYRLYAEDNLPTLIKAEEVDFDTRDNRPTRIKSLRATQN